MASVQNLPTGKRRQPFCDNVEMPCGYGLCSEREDGKKIVCECDRLGHAAHQCSQNGSIAKKTCDGVSSLQFQSPQNNFMSSDMQYDFYAMQCNNNTSAVNLNTLAQAHSKNTSHVSQQSESQPMTSDDERMDVCQVVPEETRRCLRCMSGEPGHINHILS